MTDDRLDPTAADGELLSAYLAGDLDDAEAGALERRLANEPQLAAALDVLADALVALGGFDNVETPAGYEDRLSQRLPSPPAGLAAHRQRRLAGSQWLRIGAVAAVLVAGTVMAGAVLRTMGGGPQVAMESADSAGSESASAELNVGTATRPSAPVILDNNVKVADEEALRRRYSTLPEAQALLGVPLDEATDLAMVFGEAVANRDTAENYGSSAVSSAAGVAAAQADDSATGGGGGASSGTTADSDGSDDTEERAEMEGDSGPDASKPPAAPQPDASAQLARPKKDATQGDRCLDAITMDAGAPLVPVRVETLRYAGQRALSYVLVTSTPGSDALDRTEVWVVRRSNCATIVFQQY